MEKLTRISKTPPMITMLKARMKYLATGLPLMASDIPATNSVDVNARPKGNVTSRPNLAPKNSVPKAVSAEIQRIARSDMKIFERASKRSSNMQKWLPNSIIMHVNMGINRMLIAGLS